MQIEPTDPTPEILSGWLHTYWDIRPATLTYAPVGHGSHHWIAADGGGPRWFVTADRLARDSQFATLVATADTASGLAEQGYEFVLPPLPAKSGTLVQRVRPDWALHVYPYIHGWSADQGSWNDPAEHAEVARLIGRLHSATPPGFLPRWDFGITPRQEIEFAFQRLDEPWSGGPYAEPARALLTECATRVAAGLDHYDDLVREIEADSDPWVLTHGEPDSDNVIRADTGRLYLIDWDSAKLAPRERDLVDVLPGTGDVLAAYQQTAGSHAAQPAGIELFTLWWVLHEIRVDIKRFRSPHPDSAAMAGSWQRMRDVISAKGSGG